MKKTLLIAVIALIAALLIRAERDFSPSDKLRYAFAIIDRFYVDSVDANKIVEDGIVAMLKELDPHSTYTNPEETKEMTQPLQGNFSGIGIQFNMLNDTLFVIQTTSGGPSEKVGILAGDRILSANDTAISGVKLKNSDILRTLRGPKGTVVDLKVLRRGQNEPMTFRVVRDDIPIYSVDAAYMADPTTGYIRLSRFAETTPDEIEKAMKQLKKEGMVNLILDLQDNGGGLLGSSTALAEHFLNFYDMIVFTNGRAQEPYEVRAHRSGDFKGRLVVLVNQYSASASEITSGAIQDHDRGVIVGRRTFGKGLVQRPMPFPDGSMVKITTSRYYTPSGRCIQKPYEEGHSEDYGEDMVTRYESGEWFDADKIKLDTTQVYHTLRNGRTVYGGGGIMPDEFVPMDTTQYTRYYRSLMAKGVINQFCITYVDQNRKELRKTYPTEKAFLDNFQATPDIMQQLIQRGVNEGVEYNDSDYQTSRPLLENIVKAVIGRDLYETSTYYKVMNPTQDIYRRGLDIINDERRYNSLLQNP